MYVCVYVCITIIDTMYIHIQHTIIDTLILDIQ
jgi:hypothetical protein